MKNTSKREETFLTPPGSTIKIIRNWLPDDYGNYILNRIQEEIPFAFYRRHSYERDYDVPRGMFMFGDFANITTNGYISSTYKYYENDVQYPVFNWNTPLEKLIIPIETYPNLVKPIYQRIYKPRDPNTYRGESIGVIIKQLMIYFNTTMDKIRRKSNKIEISDSLETIGVIGSLESLGESLGPKSHSICWICGKNCQGMCCGGNCGSKCCKNLKTRVPIVKGVNNQLNRGKDKDYQGKPLKFSYHTNRFK